MEATTVAAATCAPPTISLRRVSEVGVALLSLGFPGICCRVAGESSLCAGMCCPFSRRSGGVDDACETSQVPSMPTKKGHYAPFVLNDCLCCSTKNNDGAVRPTLCHSDLQLAIL